MARIRGTEGVNGTILLCGCRIAFHVSCGEGLNNLIDTHNSQQNTTLRAYLKAMIGSLVLDLYSDIKIQLQSMSAWKLNDDNHTKQFAVTALLNNTVNGRAAIRLMQSNNNTTSKIACISTDCLINKASINFQ